MYDTAALSEAISQSLGIDLSYSVLGNTFFDYGIAIVVLVVLSIIFRFLQWGVLLRLEALAKKTKTDIDDTIIAVFRSLKPAFYYFVAFFIAVQFLTLTSALGTVIKGILLIWIVYQVVLAVQILIEHVVKKRFVGEKVDPSTTAAIDYLNIFIKIGLWSIGILLVLSNFGVNITSLIAGLGIGGIAIAFALQNILGDLFSSFAIYFDKPFQIGDYIVVGEDSGTVEKIGIKTTRLRSLQGEEIVISNQELTTARVQNFKKLERRRVVTAFGVLYETPTKKLEKIPDMVRKIFDELSDVTLDRVHFKSLDDSALTYEVVFFVEKPDYVTYMDQQQAINLALMKRFEKEKIEFAYPTQTHYIKKG